MIRCAARSVSRHHWEIAGSQHAKRYEPKHFPHLNLGRIYMRTGKVSRATAEFERALELHPGDPLAIQSLAKLRTLN